MFSIPITNTEEFFIVANDLLDAQLKADIWGIDHTRITKLKEFNGLYGVA